MQKHENKQVETLLIICRFYESVSARTVGFTLHLEEAHGND